MEKFQTKDGNVIIYDRGRAEVINPKELEKEKEQLEEQLNIPEPSDKELIEEGKQIHPYFAPREFAEKRLVEINNILK